MKIYVQLICPDCHHDSFNVYSDGSIYCAKCDTEIDAGVEPEEMPVLH